jgi:hypothetical protein
LTASEPLISSATFAFAALACDRVAGFMASD